MTIDGTNARIMEILQKDARTSVSDISRQIQRAESTTRERIALLEKRGVLVGYRALIDSKKIGYAVQAVIRADCDMGRLPELGRALAAIPNVTSAQMTTGEKPIRIELFASDMNDLERIISTRLASLKLRDLEIGLVVQNLVPSRAAPIRIEGQPLPLAPAVEPIEPTSAFAKPVQVPPRMLW